MKNKRNDYFVLTLIFKYIYFCYLGIKKTVKTRLKTTLNKVGFILWSLIQVICFSKLLFSHGSFLEDATILKYLLLSIITFPALNLIGFRKKNPLQKAFINLKIYEKMGFKTYVPEVKDVKIKNRLTVIEFFSNGISLEKFWKSKDLLEDTLTTIGKRYCEILDIKKAEHDKRIIEVITANTMLNKFFKWNIDYVDVGNSSFFLGLSHFGEITICFSKTPHLLIAGETGGGKGVMTKNLIMQLLYKSIKEPVLMAIADFKNGLDYVDFDNIIKIIEDKQELKNLLDSLIKEMERRNILLKSKKLENIDEYNKHSNENLTRYFLIIDELVEAIDIDGLNKEKDKKEIQLRQDIRVRLTTLARLSRASGIHLILTTQLPSTKVFGNQLKNNIPGRICGRFADESASRIVLDSNLATKLPDIKGRMIYKKGLDLFIIQTPFLNNMAIKSLIKQHKNKFQIKKDIQVEKNIENTKEIAKTFNLKELKSIKLKKVK